VDQPTLRRGERKGPRIYRPMDLYDISEGGVEEHKAEGTMPTDTGKKEEHPYRELQTTRYHAAMEMPGGPKKDLKVKQSESHFLYVETWREEQCHGKGEVAGRGGTKKNARYKRREQGGLPFRPKEKELDAKRVTEDANRS